MITTLSMNILVTGGAGFIGSHLSSRLIDLGHTVTILDNLDPYYPLILKEYNLSTLRDKGLAYFSETDIRSRIALKKVFKLSQPEVVIHIAAKAGVRNSVEHPADYVAVNVGGTQNILDICREFQVKKVMIASSSSVYGANTKVPFSEYDLVESQVSPYAASKRAMEVICKTYAQVYSLPMQLFRFFTVYGPSGRPDMAPVLFTKAIDENKPITVFGSTKTKRDYTYVGDIIDGLVKALPVKDDFEIYNLGNNTPVSLQEFIDTIGSILKKRPSIQVTSKRAGDVDQTWADIQKANKAFEYKPKHTLKQGLKKFITWYQIHKDLYSV